MRQYIIYAVAMADSDQEALEMAQATATAHSDIISHPSAVSQSMAYPAAAAASPAASASTTQTASDHDTEARPASRETSAAAAQAGSIKAQAQSHPPAASETASQAAPQLPSGPTTWKAPQASTFNTKSPAVSAQTELELESANVARWPGQLMSVKQGMKAMRQYLGSVGRYGPGSGAFLTPMYGCAELPQAFCR